jgi:hypothetical protein
MADIPSKPTASSFSAGLPTETGLSPLQWSDKCFLCSNDIGESDPRGFYQGSSSMMLCHRGCLNVMSTHGGTPEDYHRATTGQEAPSQPAEATSGPSWLEFPDLAALQAYTTSKGLIPAHVKVTVGKVVLQAGR